MKKILITIILIVVVVFILRQQRDISVDQVLDDTQDRVEDALEDIQDVAGEVQESVTETVGDIVAELQENDEDDEYPEVSFGEEFEIALNETFEVEDELEVRFVSIIEDSRCPAGAECVWEGRVVIELAIQEDDAVSQAIQLATAPEPNPTNGQGGEQSGEIGEYTIEFIDFVDGGALLVIHN